MHAQQAGPPSAASPVPLSCRVVEQALLLARLSAAVVYKMPSLLTAFSAPAAWPQTAAASPAAVDMARVRRFTGDTEAAADRLASAVEPFKLECSASLLRWARWAADGLADVFVTDLREDFYLTVRIHFAVRGSTRWCGHR